jgi:hypothetical protein
MTHALSRYLRQPRYMFNPASDTPETWMCRGSAFALSAFRFMLSWHPESRQRRQRQKIYIVSPPPKRRGGQPSNPILQQRRPRTRNADGRSAARCAPSSRDDAESCQTASCTCARIIREGLGRSAACSSRTGGYGIGMGPSHNPDVYIRDGIPLGPDSG